MYHFISLNVAQNDTVESFTLFNKLHFQRAYLAENGQSVRKISKLLCFVSFHHENLSRSRPDFYAIR